ncbi:MAG: OB-fold nucleic acid binding domain-containing protein, partial [Bacillales bacterium]
VIGNEKKIAEYIRELKEMGYSILPPSINKSGYGFLVENNQIRYSLAAIKGVGIAALREIFKARKSGNFQDLFDFCLRVPIKSVNRKTIEALVYSGSFDEFGVDRAVLLASIDVAVDHAQLVKPDGVDQGDLLFDLKPKYVEVEPLSIENKLRFEKEVLGFYLSAHPVSAFAEYFPRMGVRPLDRLKDSRFEKTAVLIADIRKIRTRKGEAMAFLTLSDQSGEMDGVVFPKVYKRIMVLLQKGNILVFEGRVDVRRGKRQLVIENALDIKTAVKEMEEKRTLYLKIEKTMENREALHELKKILEECKGDTDVVLFYESSGKILRLKPEERVSPSESLLKKLSSLLGTQNVVLK